MTPIVATTDRRVEPRGRRRLVALAVVVAIVGSTGAFAVRELSAPRALSFGNATGTTARIGEVSLVGMGSSSKNIVVRHAEPVLRAGSAAAAVNVMVCHSQTPYWSLGTGRGWASFDQFCTEVVPATGARLHAYERDSAFDYFVLTVVPLESGRIVVDGIRVTHSGRWHDSTERTGSVVTIDTESSA